MKPAISVIVPIYNTERYLSVCIESILGQTFADFELILVNDGSPDNSAQICDSYREKDSRIQIVTKENGGLSSARNAGLEVAGGKYVMFVDSDDYIEVDCLEKAYTVVKNTNADLYIGGYYEINEAKQEKLRRCVKTAKMYTVAALLNRYELDYEAHWLSLAWGKLFRVDIIKENGILFDTWFNYKEDAPFVYTYLRFVDCVYFDSQPICNYRLLRDGSLNKRVHKNMYEINCKVYKIKRELMMDRHCPVTVYNHVYFGSLLNSIDYYFLSDHPACLACRQKTIEAVCENETLAQISLGDISGMKRKLLFVLCKHKAKRMIAAIYWLRSRFRG